MPKRTTKSEGDLAAAIRAKVAEARLWFDPKHLGEGAITPAADSSFPWPAVLRSCDLADAILARHELANYSGPLGPLCDGCGHLLLHGWPCPDVRDLATAWGVGE